MPFEIPQTTAENVIAATDAVLSKPPECDLNYIAQFIDLPVSSAEQALTIATQLGLIEKSASSRYSAKPPFAEYLVTSRDMQKAAVMRILLENYDPYKFFKSRLELSGHPNEAAQQVKVLFALNNHRDEIKETLISLGTFSQSLVTEGAGLFKPVGLTFKHASYLEVVAQIAADRSVAESHLKALLSADVYRWIDQIEIFNPLTTSFQRLADGNDARAVIVYSGNAIESFLTQLGNHFTISLSSATGINAKVDTLRAQLTKKHQNALKFLGHYRNAADHGIDSETGASWEISKEIAAVYAHMALGVIRSIVKLIDDNQYEL